MPSHDVPASSDATDRGNDRFQQIVDGLRGTPGLQEGTGFSTDPGLRLSGMLFAMLRNGELVVRVSTGRAEELVLSHGASRFYATREGRLAEWVALPQPGQAAWVTAAHEALGFAREAGCTQVVHGTIGAAPFGAARSNHGG